MSETASIDSVLSGEPDEVVEVETPQTEAEAPTVESEVEVEATAETETEQAAPTAEQTPEVNPEVEKLQRELNAFKAKALDETNKRQQLQQQFEQKQVETPDPYVEPDKAIAFEINKVKADFDNKFLNMSELNARSRHGEDFDQMTEVFFSELAVQNPMLNQQALQQPDPYEFIYQQAKTHSEFKGINSVDDLRSKLETEIRAKIEAEQAEKQKSAAEQAITNAIPKTLSTATAAGGNQAKAWEGPSSINKLVGD